MFGFPTRIGLDRAGSGSGNRRIVRSSSWRATPDLQPCAIPNNCSGCRVIGLRVRVRGTICWQRSGFGVQLVVIPLKLHALIRVCLANFLRIRVFFHLKQVRHSAGSLASEQLFACSQVNSLVEAFLPNNCSPVARLTARLSSHPEQLFVVLTWNTSRTCGTSRTIIPRFQLPACWIT